MRNRTHRNPALTRRHILLLIPILLFFLLKWSIDQEGIVWGISWYTRAFQFYVGTLGSLVAIIVALFSTSIRKRQNPRATFIAFAFVNMSALLLISSISTPTVVFTEVNRVAFFWSLRFAFPVGALFFLLATIHWEYKPRAAKYITLPIVGLISLLGLSGHVFLVFFYPAPLLYLQAYNPLFANVVGTVAALLFLLATHRVLHQRWPTITRIDAKLPAVFILLAEATLFQTFGVHGSYSWLLHNPVVITALMLAVVAILGSFESSKDIQFSRYFAVLGSILIATSSLVFTELAPHWLTGVPRTMLVPLILTQSIASFLILFVIVHHLNRLIRERNEALEREQRLRSELTQLIVHDLKSPLSVITSGINLLGKGNLGEISEAQGRLLSNLEGSGKQILAMINDLLDVERFENRAIKLQTSRVNVLKLMQEVVDDFQVIAAHNQQHLRLISNALLYDAIGDKRLLQRVFHNLLNNALKFTPKNGRITINLSTEDNHLVIRVADDGPGIPLQERERIFEKFAQVNRVERRGAGLGLTFCKMVAEAHNGFVYAEESSMGGAQFCLGLPLATETEDASSLPSLASPDLSLKAL